MRLAFLLLLAALAVSPSAAHAQYVPELPDSLSDQARLSLLTVLPGDFVYSMWGHSAVRVVDPATGLDASFNYGTFDFRDPVSFIRRFIDGRLDYMLSVSPTLRAVQHYARNEGRPTIEQHLAFDADQAEAVYQYLRQNAQPENRTYRYNFLYNNCSTRIRDVLTQTLGAAVTFEAAPDPDQTFRELVDPYVAARSYLDLGIDLVMAVPVDEEASANEAMFLPDYLLAGFDAARVGVGAATRPLVSRTDTLAWVPGYASPRTSWPWAGIVGWVLAAATVTLLFVRPPTTHARPWTGFTAFWLGVVGLAGAILLYMWVATEHTVTRPNWHLLWAWPTHLLVLPFVLRQRWPRWAHVYVGAALGVTLVALLVWPLLPQAFPPSLLPYVLMVLMSSAAAWWAQRAMPRDTLASRPASTVAPSA